MGRKKKKKSKKLKDQKLKLKNKKIEKITTAQKGNVSVDKIEIKKIKKQPNEKRVYNINDFVVYPKHGVGKIIAVEKAVIGEIDINFYKVLIERDS